MVQLLHVRKHSSSQSSSGFTLIEFLVVVAIVAILILIIIATQLLQLEKARDSARKQDLNNLKIAFEDYYNDHGCYPPVTVLDQCNSAALQPYLPKVPCDPVSKKPYPYFVDPSCTWYGLFTTLSVTSDPDISARQCFPTCGVSGQPYNYMVFGGAKPQNGVVSAVGNLPQPTSIPAQPSPSSTPAVTQYACAPTGSCKVYANPGAAGCPSYYTDPNACQNACNASANNWCKF